MISLLLAAALQTSPVVLNQQTQRTPAARYVRLNMRVTAYGINGTGEMLIDRRTARYFEHIEAGPQSFYQGFDGTRAWQADVNGTSAVQGNAVDRGTLAAWGYLFAFSRAAHVNGPVVRYADVPQPLRFVFDAATHQVKRVTLSNGVSDEVLKFSHYRTFANGISAPGVIAFTDESGTWNARVTSVETPQSVAPSAFAPPGRRNDASIAGGVTSVRFLTATEIIIPVRIDNGPEMHFILDTGGQNVLLESAVKRLGLHPIGHGTVGGAGAGVIPTSFLMVRSVRVGRAEMRNQPFLVLDSPILKGIDGIVGFELLSRFAVRVDYRTNTLTLASSLPQSWVRNVNATSFAYRSRQPQVSGAIDGIPGSLTIDTGNSGVIDINSPFAKQHNLWAYYHAAKPKHGSLIGVGGSVQSANITIHRLRLGTATLNNVYGDLTTATAGIEAHPGFAANVGEGVFRNFMFVLDYAHQHLYFGPGGISDMSGVVLARDGNRIVVRQVRTHLASRAGVRVGMTLTSVNGRPVSAADLAGVEAALRGQQGNTVNVVFNGNKHVKLVLLNYL